MKHCLIVDDSSSIRRVARRILEGFGFRVSEAENCSDALAMCAAAMPDGILIDWRMPDQDCFIVASRLRRMPHGDRTKIVYCTLEHDPMQLATALRRGMDGYLLKPFDREILKRALASAGLI
jgi:two-component system, chemotaxis family, chemotaxis protein CheY